jgi:CheY-like chemotaxis protein
MIVSGGHTDEEAAALYDAGAFAVVGKPFRIDELTAMINLGLSCRFYEQQSGSQGIARKHLRVLLAEDHKNTLRMMESVLTNMGHDALTAGDGLEAINEFAGCRGRGEKVDLLITDYKMPRINGLQLIRALKNIDPELQVVVVTAHAHIIDGDVFSRAGVLAVFEKPFSVDDIKGVIDSIQNK